jgi:hypothetical protein
MSTREEQPGEVSWGAVLFVTFVFSALAVSFVATTAALATEFAETDWFSIAALYSHLFMFFPTFGLLALAAFTVPATVFADLYFNHVPYGRWRLIIGFPVLVALSGWVASQFLNADVPAIWWLQPATLAADKGDPKGCSGETCRRAPVLPAVEAVRAESQRRLGITAFARECKPDPLLESPPESREKRYCFASRSKMTAPECCVSQAQFTHDLTAMYAAEREHSLTGRVHALALPFKVFFLLMVLCIGVLLAVWRQTIDRLYAPFTRRIERGMLIGALAMLLWPLANHAFLQAVSLLYGNFGEGLYGQLSPIFSVAFGAWALLLLMFFFRQHERDLESAAKIGGAVASVIAVLKYNQIIDYSVRFVGAGADPLELVALAVVLIAAFVFLALTLFSRETGVRTIANAPQHYE